MITIFNRRPVFISFSVERQMEIKNVLDSNGIEYDEKAVNRRGAFTLDNGSRSRVESYGEKSLYLYEYIIYVHKKDFELAKKCIYMSNVMNHRSGSQGSDNEPISVQASFGSCAVYYILMFLYFLFVPAKITIAADSMLLGNISMKYYVLIMVPVLVAVATSVFSYICIRSSIIRKPDSMFRLYLPVIILFAWQFFLCIVFNVMSDNYHSSSMMLLFGFISLNLYVMYAPIGAWGTMKLFGAIYLMAILIGFAAGERLACYKSQTVRRPFRKKYVIRVSALGMALFLISEVVFHYGRSNIVEYVPVPSGYGFAYEQGLSSTDLEPYYVENENNLLAKLETPSEFIVTEPSEMPVLDGAEAAYPIYSAFANACYHDIAGIQTQAREQLKTAKAPTGEIIYDGITMPVRFHNSIIAYEDLIDGETDIFFGAKPSANQLEMADRAGKRLRLTPIGKEAFVFFVNVENPVDGLSSQQIRDIYSGKINNWKKVGGMQARILAFQRPENSGSQTMMEYFMGELPLREPLESEYVGDMLSLVKETASYQNRSSAVGYSFRYFATIMIQDTETSQSIKFLTIDGVYPSEQAIRSGEYPITTELYAITLADNPNENVSLFLKWMVSDQGQQIVADTGYVSLR